MDKLEKELSIEQQVLDIIKKHICKTGDGGYMLFPYIKGKTKEAKIIKEWIENE